MADFLDSEAEESEQEEELDVSERKKLKKIRAMESDDEDEEDDEDRIREELKDLIDDAPIEESDNSDGEDSDASRGSKKRKKSDDDDELDDRLEDEDYDLIEENLGVKVERRKRFKRLRRFQDEESDGEKEESDPAMDREHIADQLFVGSEDEEERRSERSQRPPAEPEHFDSEGSEGEYSDADDFIVDDDGRPIHEKKKKRKPIFTDASLQEGQDIFGVDFDYEEFEKYDDDEYEDEDDEEDYDDPEAPERSRKPKKATRKKPSKSIFEIYEPSELKRGHFTDLDNEIRNADIPERVQLREFPVTSVPEGSNELDEEAEWIYKQAFLKPYISTQDVTPGDHRDRPRKPSTAIGKIKQALDFIRNQFLEVPFIAFYRKEYVEPELTINDLWKVYKFDAKWCQLRTRKKNLLTLFEKMRNYQLDQIMLNPDDPIPDSVRVIKDEDIDRLREVQTTEELRDVHTHFLLYYSHEIPSMQEAYKVKEREKAREERREARRKRLEEQANAAEGEAVIQIEEEDEEEPAEPEVLKHAGRSGPYAMCRKAQLDGFAKRFGLTPEHFSENLRDNYQRHEVEQEPLEPLEIAKAYVTSKFKTPEEVLHACKFMVATQLAREPMLRKCVREVFYERAKLNIRPTKKGIKEIDENHPCYSMKYVKNKPVRDLSGEQFLRLSMAESDSLIVISLSEQIEGNTSSNYMEEVKQLYNKDEFSKHVQDWNKIRNECVELALCKMVFPDLRRELKTFLLQESKDAVMRACCKKLYHWIKVAPYSCSFPEEDDEDWVTTHGLRVMGVAYAPDLSQAAFTALLGPDGEVTDYLRLPNILKRKNAWIQSERLLKEADMLALRNFILTKKPHLIVVGGESRDAQMIQADLRDCIATLMTDDQFPEVKVEIIDNELAKVYSTSKKGIADFREYPELLRQAVSLARRMQDPLVEYSQLCGTDDEIMCLRYHTLQDQLNKEELLENLYLEFINRTNEVGVDINLAVQQSLTSNLIQFICGLGPRKGQALLKMLKQTNQRLENRTQLVTACHMGPKVFINCSGFVKIDTNSLGDSTEAYVEVLDGSRVHPETYEWARKMAVDALEYDDEDANPAGALEEILEAPERLKDLDLDAFAEELERQGFGNKSITLYDIRAELNSRYKDLRENFKSPNPEQLFDMLTKETPETFYIGKMVLATVIGIRHRKPQGDQLDQANPVRDDETGLWQCPFCLKNDFPELSEVWSHFDSGSCPGQATGIRLRLDNRLSGFIHIKNLSDKHVKNPEERVQIGNPIHCRITKIDVDRFSVDCTSKSSDLADKNHEWRPAKDPFYDQEAEDKDMSTETESKKAKARQQYVKRIIVHPSFHNISYAEAEKIMAQLSQGEVIIRPSSKGADHLTVTWKVANDIYHHIDVKEQGKENAFSLGTSLWIGNDEFEDLDEIIARYVNPMAANARDLLNFKYYLEAAGGLRDKAEEALKEEKKKNTSKIHYFISASKNYPSKFMLSYLPKTKCRHEYITVTPDGFRFRQQMFSSLNSVLKWFKEHFQEPIPGTTPSTPRNAMSSRTPYHTTPGVNSMNPEAIHRVAQNLPSHMLQSLSQVASQTPHYPHTPGGGYGANNYTNTPYTPSGQTPFMTPAYSQTPHASHTPRYSGGFLHPGSVGSLNPGVQNSTPPMGHPGHGPLPHGSTQSPRHTPQHINRPGGGMGSQYGSASDVTDWQKAAEAWAKLKNKDGSGSRVGTPRGSGSNRTPRMDGRKTPQYSDNARMLSGKSPRSGRSTPRTIGSPHDMSMGDSTPLYDEN